MRVNAKHLRYITHNPHITHLGVRSVDEQAKSDGIQPQVLALEVESHHSLLDPASRV